MTEKGNRTVQKAYVGRKTHTRYLNNTNTYKVMTTTNILSIHSYRVACVYNDSFQVKKVF